MQTDTLNVKKKYDRIAPYFDALEGFLEGLFFRRWRKILWQEVSGEHILEVGVGTGKNFPYYPQDVQITAIDLSDKMLQRAKRKQQRLSLPVTLELMDTQHLYYADNSFDTVIATFVFCSVPQPIKGLQELYRVCKPGGQVLLLEHVLSSKPLLARFMHLINPLVVAIFGANINRKTVKNVQACGFEKVILVAESTDMVKLIQAVKRK